MRTSADRGLEEFRSAAPGPRRLRSRAGQVHSQPAREGARAFSLASRWESSQISPSGRSVGFRREPSPPRDRGLAYRQDHGRRSGRRQWMWKSPARSTSVAGYSLRASEPATPIGSACSGAGFPRVPCPPASKTRNTGRGPSPARRGKCVPRGVRPRSRSSWQGQRRGSPPPSVSMSRIVRRGPWTGLGESHRTADSRRWEGSRPVAEGRPWSD